MLRVVQITDIHLLPEIGSKFFNVDTAISLDKVIKRIMSLSPFPDIIVATGDLAEDGSKETYTRLQNILSKINIPIYVLPGNHDNINEINSSLTNNKIHYEKMVKIDKWAFIFVNSKVEGEAFGYVNANELSILEKNLNDADGLPILIALHHPPKQECPSSFCQFKNSDEFMNLIKNYRGVKGIIAGHAHTSVEEKDESIFQYTTPSTFAQFTHAQLGESEDHENFWKSHIMDGSAHGFRALDLFSEGQISSEVHYIFS